MSGVLSGSPSIRYNRGFLKAYYVRAVRASRSGQEAEPLDSRKDGSSARSSHPLHCPSSALSPGSPEAALQTQAPRSHLPPRTQPSRAKPGAGGGRGRRVGLPVSGSDPSWRASFPRSRRPRGRNARGHQAAAGPVWRAGPGGAGSRPSPGLPRPPAPPPGRRVLGEAPAPRRAPPRTRAPRLPPGCPQAGARPAGRWCSPPRARARALPGSGSRLRRGRSGEAGVRLAAPVRGSGPRPAPASPASLRAGARRPVPAAAAAATSRV